MSSVAGLRGSAGLAGYGATKGGVRLFEKGGRDGHFGDIRGFELARAADRTAVARHKGTACDDQPGLATAKFEGMVFR